MLKAEVESAKTAGFGISPREARRRESQLRLSESRGLLEISESQKILAGTQSRIDQLDWEIQSQTLLLTRSEIRSPGNGFLTCSPPGEADRRLWSLQPGGSLVQGQVAGFIQDPSVMDLEVELPVLLFKRVDEFEPVPVKVPSTLNQGKELTVKEKILEIRRPEKPGFFRVKISWDLQVLPLPPGTILEVRIPLKKMEALF